MPLTLPSAPVRQSKPCIVGRTRAALDAEDQSQLDVWLEDTDIAAWRIAESIGVGDTVVKEHRAQRCACYRGKKSP